MSAFFAKLSSSPLRKHGAIAAVSGVLCIVYMMATDPRNISLALLLVPFLLLGVCTYEVTYVLTVGLLKQRSLVFRRIIPLAASSLIVLLVLLQSLNQLTIKDGVIVSALLAVFWLYLWRADFLNK